MFFYIIHYGSVYLPIRLPMDENVGHFAGRPKLRVRMGFHFADEGHKAVHRLRHPEETVAKGCIVIADRQLGRDHSWERLIGAHGDSAARSEG